MDETTLISQAQNGDLTAFNRLIVVYQDYAYNVAYRVMGDHAAAEDAVLDVMITANKNLRWFRGG
jgi:RNA polymerase sigma-70 factor (ECF subfamily)